MIKYMFMYMYINMLQLVHCVNKRKLLEMMSYDNITRTSRILKFKVKPVT